MSEEKSEANEFKVVDKRRFTEEGHERSEQSMSEGCKSEGATDRTTVTKQESYEDKNSNAEDSTNTKRVSQNVDFSGFIISMATQALVMMGEVPNPETGIVTKNIEAARQTIDILVLLEEKTKNNLTPDEARLLEEVLHGVRMAFVNKISGK